MPSPLIWPIETQTPNKVAVVAVSTDDCRYRKTAPHWDLSNVHFYAGNYSDPNNTDYGSGARFTNITIPKGATILTAKLTLRCRASSAGTGCKTYISAEAVDDPATFADDAAAFLARYANNTATVAWDNIEAWTAGNDYDSVDFKSVIQTIVNRAGWASGQAIVIFWEDFDSRSDEGGFRDAQSYDGDSSNPPELVITFSIGKVAVEAVSTLVLAANPSRRSAVFVNDSNKPIYLSLGAAAVMNEGIMLPTTGNRKFEINDSNLFLGAIYAIAQGGAKNLTVTEGI